MTLASTAPSYAPVTRWTDLPRLAVVASSPDTRGFWTEVHDGVQEQLALLEHDVRQYVAEVQVATGRTHGKHFLLFSYLTFSLSESDIDPVVVGLTFTQADQGIDVQADVSGEQIGDLISSVPNRMVPDSRDTLLAAARESAQELRQSAKAIAASLRDSSRTVE